MSNDTGTEAEKKDEMKNDKDDEDDEDEEEDEDYDPNADKDNDEGDEDGPLSNSVENVHETTKQLSFNQSLEVDEAFDSLFGKRNEFSEIDSSDISNLLERNKLESKEEKITYRKLLKRKRILTGIFGKTEANKMMRKHNKRDLTPIKKPRLVIPEKKVVKVIQKFAGKEVCIEKKISVTPSHLDPPLDPKESEVIPNNISEEIAGDTKRPIQVKKSGLDNILADLKGPKKISTVEKTSSDWESFKDKSGLEDEFEKNAQEGKNSYLKKKEFLERVDLRRFEQEKEARNRKRAASEMR